MKISMRLKKFVAPVLVLATAVFGLAVATAAPASSVAGAKRTVIVHFNRFDGEYGAAESNTRWDVYCWKDQGAAGECPAEFVGTDDFGKYAVLTFTEESLTRIGVIVRQHVWGNQQSQNFMIDLPEAGATHIWVKANDDVDDTMSSEGPATMYTYNPDRKVYVHYARPANDWELNGHEGDSEWSWAVFTGEGPDWHNTGFTEFTQEDAYGKVAVVTVKDTAIETLNVITSANHWAAGHVQSQNMSAALNMTGDTHLWVWESDDENTDNREHSISTTNPFRVVTVHFNRDDNSYGTAGSGARWDVYYWKNTGGDGSVEFAPDFNTEDNTNDEFGRVAHIVVTNPDTTQLGVIVRQHVWGQQQTQNIMVDLPTSGEKEVWVKANDETDDTMTPDGPATVTDTDPRGRLVTIHFWRADGNYEPFDIHFWGDNGVLPQAGPANFFARRDANGAAFIRFAVPSETTNLGVIVRFGKRWEDACEYCKDATNSNRTITLNAEGPTEVWLKESDVQIYTSNPFSGDDPTKQSIHLALSGLHAGATYALPARSNRGGKISWVSMTPDTCRVQHGRQLALGHPGACRIIGKAAATEIARAATFTRTATIK